MKYNLFSISQLCNIIYKIEFFTEKCLIKYINFDTTLLKDWRNDNAYIIDLPRMANTITKCFITKDQEN